MSASRLNFSTGAIVNPLEGLQQAVTSVGSTFDKFMQREQDREDRLAREAEDRRRYETQLGRYDRQEQESLRRYEEGKELSKLEREEARRRHDIQETRQAAADKRTEQLFNQQQQDRTKTKQEEVNRDALLYGYKDIAKDAVLDTKLGRAAVTKAEAPITYTEAIEARDVAEFGDFIPKSEKIRTPYTREEIRPQVQEALLGRVDRDELAAAMVPRYRGTGLDPTEASKRLAAMNIGVDTEALQKQATENTKKMQEMVAKSVLGSDKQTTVNVNGGTQEKGLGFAPGEGTPDWYTGSWIADTNAEKLTQNRGKFIVDSGKSGFDAKDKLAEQRVMAELAAEGKVDNEGRIKVDIGPAEYKTRMQAALNRLSSEGITGEDSVRAKIKKLNQVYGITDEQGNPLDYIPSTNVKENQAKAVESTVSRLMQQYNTGSPTSRIPSSAVTNPLPQAVRLTSEQQQEMVRQGNEILAARGITPDGVGGYVVSEEAKRSAAPTKEELQRSMRAVPGPETIKQELVRSGYEGSSAQEWNRLSDAERAAYVGAGTLALGAAVPAFAMGPTSTAALGIRLSNMSPAAKEVASKVYSTRLPVNPAPTAKQLELIAQEKRLAEIAAQEAAVARRAPIGALVGSKAPIGAITP